MSVGLSAFVERVRSSLFVVPMLFVLGGVVAGLLGIEADRRLQVDVASLPLGFTSTVQSARAVLSTVAGATITVAGIAFSVSLLTIQLASSQYSPRVVSGLFRDPFNKRVIGVVVGTFAYCLVVLRSVRSAVEQQGHAVVPNLSVGVGVLLGIASILAVIAFINHNAHAMDISEILDGVTTDAIAAVERDWTVDVPDVTSRPTAGPAPAEPGYCVTFERNGWVQLLDHQQLLELAAEGGVVRLETGVGRYAIVGAPLCTIWPPPAESEADDVERRARRAVHVGVTRTLQQDVSYGIRQLVDVALKALSPGINDPTTAQDAIFHLAAVLRAMLDASPPRGEIEAEGRRLLLEQADGHGERIGLAYDEIRLAAASKPAVAIYLLEQIALLRSGTECIDRDADRALRRQADLVMDGARRQVEDPYDLGRVRRIHERHFGVGTPAVDRRDGAD